MVDSFTPGLAFTAATGLKTGANLDDLVALALFAAGSPALDQVTLDDDGAGAARIKAGGVDTAQLATGALSADATGRGKMADDFFTGQDGLDKFADGFWSADAAGRLPFGAGVISNAMLAADAVDASVIDAGTITATQLATRAGLPTGAEIFAFHVYASGNLSITSGSTQVLKLNTELYDAGAVYNTGTWRYVPGVIGYYWISGQVQMSNIGIGKMAEVRILKNGSVVEQGDSQKTAVIDDPASTVSGLVRLTSITDYIQLGVYHTHGSNRDALGGTPSQTYMTGFMASNF